MHWDQITTSLPAIEEIAVTLIGSLSSRLGVFLFDCIVVTLGKGERQLGTCKLLNTAMNKSWLQRSIKVEIE